MGKDAAMQFDVSIIPDVMLGPISALVDNLMQSAPFLRYQEANHKLHADQKAMQLLQEFLKLQQKLRANQYSVGVLEHDLNRLSQLQEEITTSAVIREQESARQDAVNFLKEVNLEISTLLGVDFASMARRSSGCC